MTAVAFPRPLLERSTREAAALLVGARLVHDTLDGRRVGRIVEVEAYLGVDDQASHARVGRTARNAIMFGPAGQAYVYLVYGMYDCLNVVTETDGRAAAVLIRAVEPIAGADVMRGARVAWATRRRAPASAAADRLRAIPADRLAAGPGLVTLAFGIDRTCTGRDLCDPASPLRLEPAAQDDRPPVVETSPRIGIDYAPEPWRSMPMRFIDATSPSVSRT